MDEHSLQSPFLFDFYQKALNPSLRKKVTIQSVEALRKKLCRDPRSISMNNFGSGSSLPEGYSKKIRSIAQSGISGQKQSEILVNIIETKKNIRVLELGTSLGLNTISLSHADGVGEVITIEGNTELAEIAEENFKEAGSTNIRLIVSDIDLYLDQTNQIFDFIYVDANHTYMATRRYFSCALELISDDGIIVLDDINWSSSMRNAWDELIIEHSDHLFIENDKLGIVFVNVQNENNHYFLKF